MKKFLKELCETIIVLACMYVAFQIGHVYGMAQSEYKTEKYNVEQYTPEDGYNTPYCYTSEVTAYESGLKVIRDLDLDGNLQACNLQYDGKNVDISWFAKICEAL